MAGELKKLLSIGRGFWDAQVILAAVRLEIFDGLKNYSEAVATAKKYALDLRGAVMLLDALASLGLLEKRGSRYKAKAEYYRLLSGASPDNILSILKHYHFMYDDWGRLADVLKTGKPVQKKGTAEARKAQTYQFIKGMDNLTKFFKDRVVKNIELKGAKKFLDIGAGPATYMREILKNNKEIKGYILDFPDVVVVAKEFLKKDGLAGRVKFIEGDLETSDLGNGYDAILISQVLHAMSVEMKINAVKKAYQALKKGGKLYIHEFYMNETRTFPKDNVIFCLNMLLHAPGGDNLTPSQIKNLMTQAGFKITDTVRFHKPDSVLVEGVKL